MPQKTSRSDIVIFCAVAGGFMLAVLASLFLGLGDRALGIALVALGTLALACAQSVATAKEKIGERLPLWPGKNTLRPFTVRLWGGGVLLLGIIMVAGL
jgi:hypothetical protein